MSKYFYHSEVLEIRDETPEAYTLVLKSPDNADFSYLSGQYLTIRAFVDGEELRRAYSLSSSPYDEGHMAISIKRVKGGKVSNYLRDTLQVGDMLEIMKPMGSFSIDPNPEEARHCIMIGAGSGITPLFSMIKTILTQEPESKVSLWYGNRNQDAIMFARQLSGMHAYFRERFHVLHVLSRPDESWQGMVGRLDKKRVYKLLSDLFMKDEYRKEYYICGPQGMMDASTDALETHAVHPGFVHQEYFSAKLPTDEELEAQLTLTEDTPISDGEETYELHTQDVVLKVDGKTHSLTVEPNKTILDAALDQDIDVPYTCRAGICTTCIAKLNAGLLIMDTTDGLSEEELEEGYILTCQAHPLDGEVEVEFE